MSNPGPRVLVVDDEPAIRNFLRTVLGAHGYTVAEAGRGEQAIAAVTAQRPDLIVLDLGLPDMDGVQVTRILREWTPIPILILSVRGSEQDKIAALDAGADDYLTKPFGSGELLARLRVLLRRVAASPNEPALTTGALHVDLGLRRVTLDGQEVQLTPTEYDLLRVLVNVSNLRRKLEPDPARPRYIITEPGVGYRLRSDA